MAAWILVERRGRWAQATRRLAGERPLPLVEARSVGLGFEALAAASGSAVGLDLDSLGAEETARCLERLACEAPAAMALVLGTSGGADDMFRELGAAAVVPNERRLRSAVELVRRHLAFAPRAERSWSEEIRGRLPWGTAGNRTSVSS